MKKILCTFLMTLLTLSVCAQDDNIHRPPKKPLKQQQVITGSGKPSKPNKQTTATKQKTGIQNGYEWVDLGLSVKWATKNVGASSPDDYGGYYAWGETHTKSNYAWNNSFDCVSPSNWEKESGWGTYKKGGQNKITPASGHDTARENWGGTWRMPTDAENAELYEKCKWKWTTKNGHNGYIVTGPNGNSIFLPAAGFRSDTRESYVGVYGYYWSCTLGLSHSYYGRCLYFNSDYYYVGSGHRRNGRSVRPVTE